MQLDDATAVQGGGGSLSNQKNCLSVPYYRVARHTTAASIGAHRRCHLLWLATEMPSAVACPNSRWRVVHNAFVCSNPSVDSHTVTTAAKGNVVIGEFLYDGWLKLAPSNRPGWVKLEHAPFGTLFEREPSEPDGKSPPQNLSVADLLTLERSEFLPLAADQSSWMAQELAELLQFETAVPARSTLELSAMRFLLVQPECGLCNRLRVIASALAFCKATRRVLLVQWYPDDVACGCTFEDLFETHDEIIRWPLAAPPPRGARKLQPAECDLWRNSEAREALIRRSLPTAAQCDVSDAREGDATGGLLDGLQKLGFLGSKPAAAAQPAPGSAESLSEILSSRCIIVRTCADFYPTDGLEFATNNACRPVTPAAVEARSAVLRSLVPRACVVERLPQLRASGGAAESSSAAASAAEAPAWPLGTAVVGIHIRRGDNSCAIAASPLTLFVRWMDEAVARDKGIRFYLSTDCLQTEAELLARFGTDRVLVQGPPHSRSRSTADGIRSALVDLLSLASTDRIVGTYYSSFSTLAATWNGVPLQVLSQ